MSILICDLSLVLRYGVGATSLPPSPWYERDVEDILERLQTYGMGMVIAGPTRRRPIDPGDDLEVVLTVRHALPMKDVGEQCLEQELSGCGVDDTPVCIAASVSRWAWKRLTYEHLATMRPRRFTCAPKRVRAFVGRVLNGNLYASETLDACDACLP